MAFYKVEDCPVTQKDFWGWKSKDERDKSTSTIPLSIWRCWHCRKLCCVQTSYNPPAVCGFCKRR